MKADVQHGDTEGARRFTRRSARTSGAKLTLLEEDLTQAIIGAAIDVHKALGPGLLESVYEECLAHELRLRKLNFARQVRLPILYKGSKLKTDYRMDFLVADAVVVENKSVEVLLPVHEAQLLTYLRLSTKKVGLLFNFNVDSIRNGILRRVL
jgi:GxxExxY protein